MSDESTPADPLRRTLAELREELDRLIGDEIALLTSGCVEGAAPEPFMTGPRRERPGGPGSPRDRPDRSGRAEVASEAGRRLDALALHLEGRLKRSRDREVESRSLREDSPRTGPALWPDAPRPGGD